MLLIVQETMRLLLNHQRYSQKASHLNKSVIKDLKVLSPFYDVKKQRPKMILEKCDQRSVSIEIPLDLKVCFSLVTY